jgi:hypothetical protein
MVYSNTVVVIAVIAVVICVVGIAFAGTYFLNKSVNQGDR